MFVFLVQDERSAYLVDTGVGVGNDAVEKHYRPERVDLLGELSRRGVGSTNLAGIVCSHLHFDHCGNNRLFPGVPIFVQRLEYEATLTAGYTVPEWLHFEGAQYRLLDGAENLSPRVRLIPTPGHTVGHQSVTIDGADGVDLIVAQAAYSAEEFQSYLGRSPRVRNDAWSTTAYAESLQALHALRPRHAYFTHDRTIWKPERTPKMETA